MKKLLLFTLLVTQVLVGYGQTGIQGMINSDSTLRKTKSPYLVTGDLVISPTGKLIIQPGVVLRFAKDVRLEIRGTLIALGTKTDSISFVSNVGTDRGLWQGIDIKNTLGGNATFAFCNISNASAAINEECCGGGKDKVKNSRFTWNNVAMSGYTGSTTPVDSCYFGNNTYCITQADKSVNRCVFENNDYGLYSTERISVSNSTFTNHSEAALYGGRGTLANCTITNNNTGVKSFFEGFTIKKCNISNNQVGIELGNYDGYVAPVDSSTICSNVKYNVKNNSTKNVNLFSNCWCTSNQTEIEKLLYDGTDDSSVGFISYTIYDQNCKTVIKKVDKVAMQKYDWNVANSPYIITQNYVVNAGDTLLIQPGVKVRFADNTSLIVRGTLIALGTKTDSISFVSNTGKARGLWQGIDVKNTLGGNASFAFCNFSNASAAINEECCGGGKDKVKNSHFTSNIVAMSGYTGSTTPVDSCYFGNNTYCITQADKSVNHCVFENNDYGLYSTERISVSNSTFTNHSEAALYGGRGTLANCTITNNNTGVKAFFEGFTIMKCNISNNQTGIELGNYDGYVAPVDSSTICSNVKYNVKNNSTKNVNLFSNCWCTSNQTEIEKLIYDGTDDSNVGFISYTIYDQDCKTVIKKVDKVAMQKYDWNVANSPYIITQNYVVNAGDTLLIQPGVKVRFADNTSLIVRGTLIALGTKTDSISFVSNTGTARGLWQGIDIKNTLGGNASFGYCNISNAFSAINEECCGGGKDKIKNTRFTSNTIGLSGYTGSATPVDSCYFGNNSNGITQGDKSVNHCIFDNNDYGLNSTERVSVSNSTFTNHTEAALYGGRGALVNCTITNNNTGVKSFFEGFTIKKCNISNNQVGIELGNYDGYVAQVDSSTICSNVKYNVRNNSNSDVNLYTNCWCNADSTTVENLIYDGWDNLSLGLVNYTLFSSNCVTPIFKTYKREKRVVYFPTDNHEIESNESIVYPNPATDFIFIKNNNNLKKIKIYEFTGKLLVENSTGDDKLIKLNVSQLNSGLYILELIGKDAKSTFRKVTVKR
jgi:hypothetical protein